MSELVTPVSQGIFPFMSLPLEIREKIYGEVLVTACCQPGVVDRESEESEDLERYSLRDETPGVHLLLVCKKIRDEATPILYSKNTFSAAAVHDLEWDHVHETFRTRFYVQDEQIVPKQEREVPQIQRLWKLARKELVVDVGKIFDSDVTSLPRWLFDTYIFEPNILFKTKILYDDGLGRQFQAFLRDIGRTNTALIRRVELFFGDMVRSADYFPIYAEILRQHFPALRGLLIGKVPSDLPYKGRLPINSINLMGITPDFSCINDYGSDCDWDEPNEDGREGREQLADDAVVALFQGIRQLFKDKPDLNELRFYSCFDSLEKLGRAILKEKLLGKTFNIRKRWEELTPLRTFGRGHGHPLPHPIFTYKGQGPEAFKRAKFWSRAGRDASNLLSLG